MGAGHSLSSIPTPSYQVMAIFHTHNDSAFSDLAITEILFLSKAN